MSPPSSVLSDAGVAAGCSGAGRSACSAGGFSAGACSGGSALARRSSEVACSPLPEPRRSVSVSPLTFRLSSPRRRSRAVYVWGPATPSTARSFAACRRLTAAWVRGPYTPSIGPTVRPAARRSRWSAFTCGDPPGTPYPAPMRTGRGCAVRNALRVAGPTIPSAANPERCWRRRTAPSVSGPNRPSTGPGLSPSSCSRRCSPSTGPEPSTVPYPAPLASRAAPCVCSAAIAAWGTPSMSATPTSKPTSLLPTAEDPLFPNIQRLLLER